MRSQESLPVAIEAPPEDTEAPDALEAVYSTEAPLEDCDPMPSSAVVGTTREAEAVTDPILPPRPQLMITSSVGRGARNGAADVRAVQDRLIELRALDRSDASTEHPMGTDVVADTTLPRTIAAIERFQRDVGIAQDGKVDVRSPTHTDLNRCVPHPGATEFTAVATARTAVPRTVSRGLTLQEAVGATTAGNLPADVQAVQRRLVELGRLAAGHRETPLVGSTVAMVQTNLRATIAALRAFQQDVRFWHSRRAIAGSITSGVASPGDATAALLDRIAVYTVGAEPAGVSFRDHVVSGATQSAEGVMFVGTARPSGIAVSDYHALGLTRGQAAALRFVSTHEGHFDAINTYDRALVSVGFIQFAGSRGLPAYLALLKVREPSRFGHLLRAFGIDIEFTVSGGAIDAPRVAVLDPGRRTVLRAVEAERAIRDDKTLTAALILSGRDRRVQLVQIEAAIRGYVLPALAAVVSWGPGAARARLGELLRSQKGMAALFDRAIQEGLAGARRRFERIIRRVVRGSAATDPPPPSVTDLQRREGDLLTELERDLQAAADVSTRLARAHVGLDTLLRAAAAAAVDVRTVLARPELSDTRRAVRDARTGLSAVVNVSTPRGATVEATLASIMTTLTAEDSRLSLTPPPSSAAMLTTMLAASRQALATAAGPLSTAQVFLARTQKIRRSTLDATLTELAELAP